MDPEQSTEITETPITGSELDTTLPPSGSDMATDTGSTVDYTEQLDAILTELTQLNDHMDYVHGTMEVIASYGMVFIPLLLAGMFLWWIFKQFINSY